MSEYIIPDRSAHWYDKQGKPAYEVPRADGKGLRATTIADAKKLGLVPSVTSIMGILYKPALQNWIATQYVLSALTLPHQEGESMDAFARRVVYDANTQSRQAAEYGSSVHSLAELYVNGKLPSILEPEHVNQLSGFMLWCEDKNVTPVATEYSFAYCADHMPYGGKFDFLGYIQGLYVLVDWKTQRTKPGERMNFYNDWGVQLYGYKKGVHPAAKDAALMSVCISSSEPDRVESFIWMNEEELEEAWDACRTVYYGPLGRGYGLRTTKE